MGTLTLAVWLLTFGGLAAAYDGSISILNTSFEMTRSKTVAMYDGDDSVYVIGGRSTENNNSKTGISKLCLSTESLEVLVYFPIREFITSGHWDRDGNIWYFGQNRQMWKFSPKGGSLVQVKPKGDKATLRAAFGFWNKSQGVATLFGGKVWKHQITQYIAANNSGVLSTEFSTIIQPQACVWDEETNSAYVISHDVGTPDHLSNVYKFDPSTQGLNNMSLDIPMSSLQTAAVFDGTNIYLIGGYKSDGVADVVRLDPETKELKILEIEDFPSSLYGSGAVYVKKLNRIYLFGGIQAESVGYPTGRWRHEIFYITIGPDNPTQLLNNTDTTQEMTKLLGASVVSPEILPILNNTESTQMEAPVSSNTKEETEIVPISNNTEQPIQAVPVSNNTEQPIQAVPVSNDTEQPIESVSVSNNTEQPIQALSVSNNTEPLQQGSEVQNNAQNTTQEAGPISNNTEEPIQEAVFISNNTEQPAQVIVPDSNKTEQQIQEAVPVSNNTGQPIPKAVPVLNNTEQPIEAVPTANSTKLPDPALPFTNNTELPDPALPVTNSTKLPDPALSVTNSTKLPDPALPMTNITQSPPEVVPISIVTDSPQPAAPISNNTEPKAHSVPVSNSAETPAETLPVSNSTELSSDQDPDSPDDSDAESTSDNERLTNSTESTHEALQVSNDTDSTPNPNANSTVDSAESSTTSDSRTNPERSASGIPINTKYSTAPVAPTGSNGVTVSPILRTVLCIMLAVAGLSQNFLSLQA